MWSYETTRAASLQGTSSQSFVQSEVEVGTQVMSGPKGSPGPTITVEITRVTVNIIHQSHYGDWVDGVSTVRQIQHLLATMDEISSVESKDTTSTDESRYTDNGSAGTESMEVYETVVDSNGGSFTSSSANSYATIDPPTMSWNYTTSTQSISQAQTVTTSQTGTSSYRSLTSYSSTTSTGTATSATRSYTTRTTTSVSASGSHETTTTSSVSTTGRSYVSSSAYKSCYLDTILVADSTDWGWIVTGTGSGILSQVGESFTRITLSRLWDFTEADGTIYSVTFT